jgi:hypothetical protein
MLKSIKFSLIMLHKLKQACYIFHIWYENNNDLFTEVPYENEVYTVTVLSWNKFTSKIHKVVQSYNCINNSKHLCSSVIVCSSQQGCL